MIGNVKESTIYEGLKQGLTIDTKGVDLISETELRKLIEKTNYEIGLVLALFDGDFDENKKLIRSEKKVKVIKKGGVYDKISKNIVINRVKKILGKMKTNENLSEDVCTEMENLVEMVVSDDIDIKDIKEKER